MHVYISNGGDGTIGCHRLHADGSLAFVANVDVGAGLGPMTVRRDRRVLVAACRQAPTTFASFAIDRSSGALSLLERTAAHDSFPYIVFDATGRYLLAASYSASIVTVNAVDSGGVVEAPALQVIPVGRHAHSIRLDETNRYAFVPTLGSDQIFQFVFDDSSGWLTSNTPAVAMVKQGTGPRHLWTSPDNRFLYVLNEMTGTVTRFSLDESTGLLTEHESVLALPPDTTLTTGFARGPVFGAGSGASAGGAGGTGGAGGAGGAPAPAPAPRSLDNDIWAADMHLTPDGRFLYASERASSSITAFKVDASSGKLSYVATTPTEKQPRGFAIDPDGKWLIAVGEKSDRIAVYAIDGSSGMLREAGRYPGGNGASWVEIVAED